MMSWKRLWPFHRRHDRRVDEAVEEVRGAREELRRAMRDAVADRIDNTLQGLTRPPKGKAP